MEFFIFVLFDSCKVFKRSFIHQFECLLKKTQLNVLLRSRRLNKKRIL